MSGKVTSDIQPSQADGTSVSSIEKGEKVALSVNGSSENEDVIELRGPEPTEEEVATLRLVRDSLPLSTFFVVIVELAERFTYYGLSGVFQNYMSLTRDNGRQTGGLGLGSSTATALSYFFQFWCYLTPIPAGLIADMWLGKYNTIFIFTIIYIIGNLVLTLSSIPSSINSGHAEGGLIAAMIIIGIGTGGIKSNVSTLVADQYTNTRRYVKTLKSGERVIVDPARTMQYIFLMFYWAINLGSLSAIATTELEQHVDFWAAYLLPAAFFFVALIALILGRKKYIRRPAQGSPVPHSMRIIGMALKNMFAADRVPPSDSGNLVPTETSAFDRVTAKLRAFIAYPFRHFTLDVARPSVRAERGLSAVPWTDNFVDQVYRSLIACRVFVFYPIYWLEYGQMLNNFVTQAGFMETHGIPNDIMQNIDPISIIIFVPLMDFFGYPLLRKMGFELRPMTRIAIGFVAVSIAMAYAAIVQHLIDVAGPCYKFPTECAAAGPDGDPNHVHVAIQTPAYFFIAMSEIFTSVTGYEYAYTKAPPTMKSFIMSLFLLTNAFGSALGIALSPVSKSPKWMWNYIGLACASTVCGGLFYLLYHHLNKVDYALDNVDAAERENENANRKFGGDEDPLKGILHPHRTNATVRSGPVDDFDATEQALVDSRLNANN